MGGSGLHRRWLRLVGKKVKSAPLAAVCHCGQGLLKYEYMMASNAGLKTRAMMPWSGLSNRRLA